MNQSKLSSLVNRISIYLVLTILSLIDITSMGSLMLHSDLQNGIDSRNISVFFTLLNTIYFQLFYNFFTSMNIGIIAGPILEAYIFTSKIHKKAFSQEGNPLTNTCVAITISTLFYALISLLLSVLKISYIAKCVPSSTLVGCLNGIAICLIFSGKSLFCSEKITITELTVLCLSIFLSFVLFLIYLKKPHLTFLPVIYCTFFTLLFYALVYAKVFDLKQLKELKFIGEEVNLIASFKDIKKDLDMKNLRFKAIWALKKEILLLVIYNLIHLPTNILSYCKSTNVCVSIEKEFKTQGIVNLFGLFALLPIHKFVPIPPLFPGYFINCYSVSLHKSGFCSFYDGIFIALFLCSLLFLVGFVQSNVPLPIQSIFPCFIGISMCYSGFIESLKTYSYLEYGILVITSFVSWKTEIYYGLIVGILLSFVLYFYSSKKCIKVHPPSFLSKLEGKVEYLKIDFVLFFAKIIKFENLMFSCTKKFVIIDLKGCYAFDTLGNNIFRDSLKNENRTFIVIGRPKHANFDEIKFFKNVELCNDYDQADCVLSDF